jgi:prepilin-type N-terminal cleavage/methylation domain-containing protein
MKSRGFTIIELLVTIAIIGILSGIVIVGVQRAREKAYYGRALAEFKTMTTALDLYKSDHDDTYPDDENRSVPPGLEAYIAGGVWPDGPWPGSDYDWENWDDPDNPGNKIYQVSIRFCAASGNISTCKFPNESWAHDFGVDSSVYYCIQGSCRAHISEPINYPGYCVNCGN